MTDAPLKFKDRELPRICFVAHFAYGELAGIDSGHAGGIERQQAMMARWLAARGYPVSMVTWDEGQADGETTAGVTAYKMCRRDRGVRGLRFIHPRWTSLWGALRRADADVYYYNCGDLALGQVVWWCRRHGRKCVYSVASTPDCDPRLPALKPLRERWLYRYGLLHADRVIAQTGQQRDLLREGFGLASVRIPMPCEGISERDYRPPLAPRDGSVRVLWVGRISPEKRLEWLLDLAEQCPDISFDVVGAANAETPYASALVERAAGVGNVTLHGRVARAAMERFYRRADVLCCTSVYEGFPNTFLEAWNLGVPVVTTFDPDHVVAERGLGGVASDVEGLARVMRGLVESRDEWCRTSENCRRFYVENHTPEAAMPRFERVFRDVATDRGIRGAPLNIAGGFVAGESHVAGRQSN